MLLGKSTSQSEELFPLPESPNKTHSLNDFPTSSGCSNVENTSIKKKQVIREMNGVAHFSLKDFDLLKVLGKGTYGKVRSETNRFILI